MLSTLEQRLSHGVVTAKWWNFKDRWFNFWEYCANCGSYVILRMVIYVNGGKWFVNMWRNLSCTGKQIFHFCVYRKWRSVKQTEHTFLWSRGKEYLNVNSDETVVLTDLLQFFFFFPPPMPVGTSCFWQWILVASTRCWCWYCCSKHQSISWWWVMTGVISWSIQESKRHVVGMKIKPYLHINYMDDWSTSHSDHFTTG